MMSKVYIPNMYQLRWDRYIVKPFSALKVGDEFYTGQIYGDTTRMIKTGERSYATVDHLPTRLVVFKEKEAAKLYALISNDNGIKIIWSNLDCGDVDYGAMIKAQELQ